MRLRSVVAFAAALTAPLPIAAQALSVPSDTLLAGITARGRLLAAYDQAAWHATDAVLALVPESALVKVGNTMVATQQLDGRWAVLFGRLADAKDTFFLVYEARPTERRDSFSVQAHNPPTPLVGPERRAAAALQVAMADFGVPQRPYNSYVLPRADGAFWVYFLPAQTDAREFPHGADVRYLVDSTGQRIAQKHAMHRALLNLAMLDSGVIGLHTVLVDDVPQDSDVFLVLARRPRRREVIATAHYNYEIALDGSITWQVADRQPKR
ncbi:MAG TPA: hypothetical protein VGQ06_02795 [Gemmatimonadales bacterium]|jgi:hypothetical protein|nr:hypothetical protein [Gemmatimonadales bacterium]